MHILQKIIQPNESMCQEEALYIRREADGWIAFDTYFNAFSIEKWKRYTNISKLALSIQYSGNATISTYSEKILYGKVERRVICSKEMKGNAENDNRMVIPISDLPDMGIIAFSIKGKSGFRLYHAAYIGESDCTVLPEVRPILIICTYKREQYVLNNLHRIINYYSGNMENMPDVIVVDNGQTLKCEEIELSSHFCLIPNKDTGATGGFTRGVIEAIHRGGYSHCILMDDDILLDPRIIERFCYFASHLKAPFLDSFIGGAMLRSDLPYFQAEAGAEYANGDITARKFGVDLRRLHEIIQNENEERVTHNGWWFCAIPMKYIRSDDLPLPFFFCMDDVEYGLRCGMERTESHRTKGVEQKHSPVILLNGLCVWHDPFDSKLFSSRFYYINRNSRIIDVIHFNYGWKQAYQQINNMALQSAYMYRYNDAATIIYGAKDFLKGAEYLMRIDPEEKNAEVIRWNIQYTDLALSGVYVDYEWYRRCCGIESIGRIARLKKRIKENNPFAKVLRKISFNGIMFSPNRSATLPPYAKDKLQAYRASEIIYYDEITGKGYIAKRDPEKFWQIKKELKGLRRAMRQDYDTAAKSYKDNYEKMKSEAFWKHYLGMEEDTL